MHPLSSQELLDAHPEDENLLVSLRDRDGDEKRVEVDVDGRGAAAAIELLQDVRWGCCLCAMKPARAADAVHGC